MHLGESSQCPSTQVPIYADCEFGSDYADGHALASVALTTTTSGLNAPGTSQSQVAAPHKVREPN